MNKTKEQSKVTLLAGGMYKIIVGNSDEYRCLKDQITEDGWEFFTYEDKNIRPIKVTARVIYAECHPEEIIEFLKTKQFSILNVTNLQKKRQKGNGEDAFMKHMQQE